MLTEEQIDKLSDYVAEKFTLGDELTYRAYGEYINAIVVYFPYKESYSAVAESFDEAAERLIDKNYIKETVCELIAEWLEENTEN